MFQEVLGDEAEYGLCEECDKEVKVTPKNTCRCGGLVCSNCVEKHICGGPTWPLK